MRRKKQKRPDTDRHKLPRFSLRLSPELFEILANKAKRNHRTVTGEILRAIHEMFEREGDQWPED